jgi:hypothetical protein
MTMLLFLWRTDRGLVWKPPSSEERVTRVRSGELIAIAVFVLANLIVPAVFGDLYPFTVTPMFSDSPKVYCEYRVLAPDGSILRLADFQLQREYDGNPPGLGAGLIPSVTLDRFGIVPEERAVVDHVARRLPTMEGLPYVDVVQEVIGPVSSERVGITRTNRWRVSR